MKTTLKHVSKSIFDKVSDCTRDDKKFYNGVTASYNGTHLYGDLTIETYGDSVKEEDVLKMIADCLAK